MGDLMSAGGTAEVVLLVDGRPVPVTEAVSVVFRQSIGHQGLRPVVVVDGRPVTGPERRVSLTVVYDGPGW